MTKTVTSLFHDQHQATATVSRLEQAGISRDNISVYTDAAGDLTDELTGFGVPASDAHAYAEGVRRGGSLVTVSCDDDEVDQVVGILEGNEGILDLDEQQNSWRAEGWRGHEPSVAGIAGGSGAAAAGLGEVVTGSSGSSRSSGLEGDLTGSPDGTPTRGEVGATGSGTTRSGAAGMSDRDEVIPVVEEELHVGKREVSHGRVRIHSHVVERPVQEQVTLRDETVAVERRPTSGRATTLTGDAFQERTIEVEEHDEQAVVSKEARVKEELVVRTDVEERTETVQDTVRRTEVDIEDERTGATRTGTTGTSKDSERR
jgi:uncharacterized protein (TIGR02271 family)